MESFFPNPDKDEDISTCGISLMSADKSRLSETEKIAIAIK